MTRVKTGNASNTVSEAEVGSYIHSPRRVQSANAPIGEPCFNDNGFVLGIRLLLSQSIKVFCNEVTICNRKWHFGPKNTLSEGFRLSAIVTDVVYESEKWS